MSEQFWLNDKQWKKLQPVLPPDQRGRRVDGLEAIGIDPDQFRNIADKVYESEKEQCIERAKQYIGMLQGEPAIPRHLAHEDRKPALTMPQLVVLVG